MIESKKGTIRANHYHPQQEQKCLFTKGQIIEIFQDILNPNSPKITQVVNEGQLSIIKPNVAHTMVFTKDTTFLNLVRGERDHENYGTTHTIRHVFVDEKEKNLLLDCYKFECRSCGNTDLKRVVSLGYQPLANNLLKKANEKCDFWQKCLFTKGQIIEVFQDIINPNAPKITQVVNAGQLSVIKPNVAHTMVFTKDTTFLSKLFAKG